MLERIQRSLSRSRAENEDYLHSSYADRMPHWRFYSGSWNQRRNCRELFQTGHRRRPKPLPNGRYFLRRRFLADDSDCAWVLFPIFLLRSSCSSLRPLAFTCSVKCGKIPNRANEKSTSMTRFLTLALSLLAIGVFLPNMPCR